MNRLWHRWQIQGLTHSSLSEDTLLGIRGSTLRLYEKEAGLIAQCSLTRRLWSGNNMGIAISGWNYSASFILLITWKANTRHTELISSLDLLQSRPNRLLLLGTSDSGV